ncbi:MULTISPECIES: glycosyltransferase [unclassified Aeromonas]|uniref:glycosyltransferase n=1 Tax=Aeromonas TaxID=642 RepID=UPI0034A55517
MTSIKIVIVLYNKKIVDSASINSILKQKYSKDNICVSLSIHDNSPLAMINDNELSEIGRELKVSYIHDGNNNGLNVIYEAEFKNFDSDYILILDDDTSLPYDYLDKFHQAQQEFGTKSIFVPKVIVFDKLVSPYKSWLFFSRAIRDLVHGTCKNIYAINSGVFLPNIKEIKNYSYPPYVSFYGTDTVLFEYVHSADIPVVVMDSRIQHELSFHPKGNSEQYHRALFNVVRFWKSHYGKNIFHLIILYAYLFYLSFRESVKNKKLINFMAKI